MCLKDLVEGCVNNDPLAQSELYALYSPKMLSICFRYASSKQDAEDMLQEGLIKVFTQIHTFECKGSLEGWIRRIIVNTCINNIKKNKKLNDQVDLELAYSVEGNKNSINADLQNKQVIDCIRLLPLGYRTVLNLYAIEGYSHKEIAQMLDIEEGTSRSQYSKAKHMLEAILINQGIVEKSTSNSALFFI